MIFVCVKMSTGFRNYLLPKVYANVALTYTLVKNTM